MALAPPNPFSFYQRISARERMLVLLVGGTAFAIANLVGLGSLGSAFHKLRQECSEQALNLGIQRLFAQEQPMWQQRMQWLRQKQPVLTSRDRAGAGLLDQVQQFARSSSVIISNPLIKPLQAGAGDKSSGSADYQAITVELDTQSDWASLVKFVEQVQQPDRFLVFDSATLRSDTDPAIMRGHFRVSKWYAPAVSK